MGEVMPLVGWRVDRERLRTHAVVADGPSSKPRIACGTSAEMGHFTWPNKPNGAVLCTTCAAIVAQRASTPKPA
jgi:hypothetical protein